MDLILTRTRYESDGVFGVLSDNSGNIVGVTLEHAYPSADLWTAKIPLGSYVCVRGEHQLAGMAAPFTTFEITGIAGHSGILFHCGNFDADSEGCILLGQSVTNSTQGQSMITNSRVIFAKFMALETDCDAFNLTVRDA
jgi:hypothetical protein